MQYKVKIRCNIGLGIRKNAEQLEGNWYNFYTGWTIDRDDSALYVGEQAMVPDDPNYPKDAPTWIASGDLIKEGVKMIYEIAQEDSYRSKPLVNMNNDMSRLVILCGKRDVPRLRNWIKDQNDPVRKSMELIEKEYEYSMVGTDYMNMYGRIPTRFKLVRKPKQVREEGRAQEQSMFEEIYGGWSGEGV